MKEDTPLVDVIKKNQRKPLLSRLQQMIVGGLILLLILVFYTKQSLDQISVKRSEIVVGEVKKGNLDVVIEGYGILMPAKQLLITSLTRSTVKEILLKPGAPVTEDSTILKLENPELMQQVENAHQELVQAKANLQQLKLNQKREALNENANIAEVNAGYQSARLKRLAEQKLVKDGIIAKNTFELTLLNERQLEQRLGILMQRKQQLVEVHQQAVNIQLEKIKQRQGRIDIAQQRADSLVVRAGLNGVLQRLSVNLGQSLSAGQEVALIGSVKELVALIKVPQRLAQQVMIEQNVIIDTRRDKINGKVIRIEPLVENNTVTVEVSLPTNLPASARPRANIDAAIIAAKLIDVNYIERPANVRTSSDNNLYKLASNYNSALLTNVRFGRQAGRYIEIISAVKVGDQFILSDLSSLRMMTERLVVE